MKRRGPNARSKPRPAQRNRSSWSSAARILSHWSAEWSIPQAKPLPGRWCRSARERSANTDMPEAFPIRFSAGEIRTDSDGRFRTPREVKRGYGYRAEITPVDEVFMPECTPWLAVKADTKPFFPKLVLRRLRTVHGRVVDSHGKPVAGASVRQAGDAALPTQVITDSEGQFALPGILAEPAFVFVSKDGFRFEGKPIGGSDGVVRVSLSRLSEPRPKPMLTLPPTLSRAEELAVLHRVFDGYAERVIKEGESRDLYEVLRILVGLDPARVSGLLSDERLEAWQPNVLRALVAGRIVGGNYDEARALIEAIEDAEHAFVCLLRSCVPHCPRQKARAKLELAQESLIAARAVADPAARVLRLADIGGRLFDLGKTEQATNVLREALGDRDQAPAIPARAPGPRKRLAEELARFDLPAALELLKGTEEDRDHDEYLGTIAHELAGKNPAEAERVLMMMRDVWPHSRDEYTAARVLSDGDGRPRTGHGAGGPR